MAKKINVDELIEFCSTLLSMLHEHYNSVACAALRGVVEFAKENAVEVEPVNGWISVKDRLPDENQKCLVYRDIDNDLKITTGIWHSDRKTFDGLCHGTRLENTIAWMPLPEPPKDGDSE